MRYDWRERPAPPPCRVIDLDTGRHLAYLAMADDVTGEYEQYVRRDGRFVIDPVTQRVMRFHGRARLQIIHLAPNEPYFTDGRTQ